MSATNTHLILIRHGQIQANIDKLWHGWTDSALTDTGIAQAERVAARIAAEHADVSAIYASPLQRTYNTALKIADILGLDVVEEPRIKEYGIGILEGVSFSDLHKKHDFFTQVAANPDFAPQQGESIAQVGDRVSTALQGFIQKHPGEKIVAVSHGAAMALALAGLFDQDWYAWNKYQFLNTGVTELDLGEQSKLIRFNCVEHLQGLE
jgi:probable phosphoglycerate mutase